MQEKNIRTPLVIPAHILDVHAMIEKAQREAFEPVCHRYGYGSALVTISKMWAEKAEAQGFKGSNFAIGPCVVLTTPCMCRENQDDQEVDCDWCCGCGWVTQKVSEIQRH